MVDVIDRTDTGTLDILISFDGDLNVADFGQFLSSLSAFARESDLLGNAELEITDFTIGSIKMSLIAKIGAIGIGIASAAALAEKPAAVLANTTQILGFIGQVAGLFEKAEKDAAKTDASADDGTAKADDLHPIVDATCKIVRQEGDRRIEFSATGELCLKVEKATVNRILGLGDVFELRHAMSVTVDPPNSERPKTRNQIRAEARIREWQRKLEKRKASQAATAAQRREERERRTPPGFTLLPDGRYVGEAQLVMADATFLVGFDPPIRVQLLNRKIVPEEMVRYRLVGRLYPDNMSPVKGALRFEVLDISPATGG